MTKPHGRRLPFGMVTRRQGNADLWSAPLRAAQRTRRTLNSGVVRTATGTSAGAVVQVRDIPPVGGTWFARLRRAVPTGGPAFQAVPAIDARWGTAEREKTRGGVILRRAKDNGSELCSLPACTDGASLGRTPPCRATRRQGNADLWPVLPVGAGTAARSAANETDLEQWGGPYSNGYFSRGSGAGSEHPASWQYVVRPPAAGGADRRSAFQAVPAIDARWGTAEREKTRGGVILRTQKTMAANFVRCRRVHADWPYALSLRFVQWCRPALGGLARGRGSPLWVCCFPG